jgi:hypothetical protein
MPVCVKQLARARRFLHRLEHRTAPDFGTVMEILNDYEDNLWSFFMNCWHVKDWVQNDDTLPELLRKKVVDAARASWERRDRSVNARRGQITAMAEWCGYSDAPTLHVLPRTHRPQRPLQRA